MDNEQTSQNITTEEQADVDVLKETHPEGMMAVPPPLNTSDTEDGNERASSLVVIAGETPAKDDGEQDSQTNVRKRSIDLLSDEEPPNKAAKQAMKRGPIRSGQRV